MEELCLMTLKSEAKCKEKLTCSWETHVGNMAIYYQSTRKPQKLDFDAIM